MSLKSFDEEIATETFRIKNHGRQARLVMDQRRYHPSQKWGRLPSLISDEI